MLYVGKCKHCGFLVHSKDCHEFKSLMAKHLNDSHRGDYDFVSKIPLKDFEDFVISRIHDAEIVANLETVMKNRGFWRAIRSHPSLQNILFSGLGGRENSLSEILRQNSARG